MPADEFDAVHARHLQIAFDPFFTTKETGTGLGLAIVHRIVENHGGSIRVEHREKGGTKFTMHIPAANGSTRYAAEQRQGQVGTETELNETTVLHKGVA